MDVKPQYNSVGELFKYQPVYRVPAYQRSYSWEQLEIEDFIKDLETCYNKRKFDTAVVHFFGQIVCIEDKLQGSYDITSFQLVDGQQRVATFTILVIALMNIYREILTSIENDVSAVNQKGILGSRITELLKRYIVFQKEVEETFQDIYVLELSNRDKSFFKAFLNDINTAPERESHKLIKKAYDTIFEKVNLTTNSANLRDRIGNLKMVEQILENDFCILNMVTSDRKSAFKLFQVLNNRGKNLTEGDLLRAESLRILEAYPANQQIVEDAWDNILLDTPILTERFLRAVYGSYTGQKAGTNSLFNEFLTYFIPEYDFEVINASDAANVQTQIKTIEKDITTLRKLNSGHWPYQPQNPIEHWDRNRMHLLIAAFDHFECLPFLLSASTLPQVEFNKIVDIIERFIFKYLIVGNQYIGDILTVYNEEAKTIRDNPGTYRAHNLIQKLAPLEAKVSDDMFRRRLDDLKYHRMGKSNKPLKYLLLTIEYYYRWYNEGANGAPQCLDKERVYDFGDSTIEHIYPHQAQGAVVNPLLEPLKNCLGNLTILGNRDNRTGENDDFITKKPIFLASSLMINRESIAVKPDWTEAVVLARVTELKEMAVAIFKI